MDPIFAQVLLLHLENAVLSVRGAGKRQGSTLIGHGVGLGFLHVRGRFHLVLLYVAVFVMVPDIAWWLDLSKFQTLHPKARIDTDTDGRAVRNVNGLGLGDDVWIAH